MCQVKSYDSIMTQTQGLLLTVQTTLPMTYRVTWPSHQELFSLNISQLHMHIATLVDLIFLSKSSEFSDELATSLHVL